MITIRSIIKAFLCAITFKLRFPKKYCGRIIRMEDGKEFEVFRHMKLKKEIKTPGSVLIVRFKFKKFSHAANISLSRIPVPLIVGFPSFREKLWMIDWETGCWQGIYQFDDTEAIEKYKKSFVLSIMNKRAIGDTVVYQVFPDKNLDDIISDKLVK